MANMRNHEVVEIWRDKRDKNLTFHVTKNDRLLMMHANAKAAVKLLHVTVMNEKRVFNFNGVGERATATAYRERLEQRAVRER